MKPEKQALSDLYDAAVEQKSVTTLTDYDVGYKDAWQDVYDFLSKRLGGRE